MKKFFFVIGFFVLTFALSTSPAARAQSKAQPSAGPEIRASVNAVVFRNGFAAVAKEFSAQTGIKMNYVNDTEKILGSLIYFKDVASGSAEMGVSAVEFEEWIKIMRKDAPDVDTQGITSRVIGKELMYVVTNNAVGIKEISPKNLARIFTGQAKNWSELGGTNSPIRLVMQPAAVSRNSTFQKRVMNGAAFEKLNVIEAKGDPESVDQVKKTPGAIAFLPQKGIDYSEVLIQKTDEVGRPITLITKGKPSENVFKFIQFYEKESKAILAKTK